MLFYRLRKFTGLTEKVYLGISALLRFIERILAVLNIVEVGFFLRCELFVYDSVRALSRKVGPFLKNFDSMVDTSFTTVFSRRLLLVAVLLWLGVVLQAFWVSLIGCYMFGVLGFVHTGLFVVASLVVDLPIELAVVAYLLVAIVYTVYRYLFHYSITIQRTVLELYRVFVFMFVFLAVLLMEMDVQLFYAFSRLEVVAEAFIGLTSSFWHVDFPLATGLLMFLRHTYPDFLGYYFVGLTFLVIGLCFRLIWPTFVQYDYTQMYLFVISLLLIAVCLCVVFMTLNLVVFFFAFECVLVPMIILIGVWGSPSRRQANNYLIFYTAVGAVPMLFAILYLYSLVGSFSGMCLQNLLLYPLSFKAQVFVWAGLFFSFAIKTPMVPVHIWLPKAHVDASTIGSVILAGLLLKIGLFGVIRFLYPIVPVSTAFFAPAISIFGTVGVLYASMVTLWQIDMKRIVAYSSVAHMNLALVSMFSLTNVGVIASVFMMLSHGFISSALFFLVGFLYNRFHQRLVHYFGGLITILPIFSGFLLFFSLANMAFPLTSGFIGEFLCLLGIFSSNSLLGILNAMSMFFTTGYMMLMFGRVCLGNLPGWLWDVVRSPKLLKRSVGGSLDLNRLEIEIVTVLAFFVVLLGIYPHLILQNLFLGLFHVHDPVYFPALVRGLTSGA